VEEQDGARFTVTVKWSGRITARAVIRTIAWLALVLVSALAWYLLG
jgi:hypothetical protein